MYKTLLVPIDARDRSARSIGIAGQLAGAFAAHVVGLYVRPPSDFPEFMYAEAGAAALAEVQHKLVRELSESAKARFDAGVKSAAIASAEWRTADGDPADVVALHARYADLVIVNQTDTDASYATHFADAVLLGLGRPALLIPHAGEFKSLGRDVLVCWNASREAARAVTDALPLLQRAKKVTVMSVDAHPSLTGHGDLPGADISLYLSRHGVKAEVAQMPSAGVDIGNVILSRAFDLGADLIVMGAYGHARVRELVMGGATRTILASMTVPVFMSH